MNDKWIRQETTADLGMVSVNRSYVSWRDHLKTAGLLILLLIAVARLTAVIGSERLTELDKAKALCAEIDQRFVSSEWYFDGDLLECRVVDGGN